jgi:REP element-mobilizing transposase RayT
MEGVVSHVVFTVKNSRYDWQKIKRKKPAGQIARTYPFFEGKEEELIINILCDIVSELEIKIAALNFCGDHVHAVIISETKDISRMLGLWKGKSAYVFNREKQHDIEYSQPVNFKVPDQNLWAKGYYQKIITSYTALENVICYINNNRKKHGIPPLTKHSSDLILNLVSKNNV